MTTNTYDDSCENWRTEFAGWQEVRAKASAFDELREAHHISRRDEEHQGGNCADIVLHLMAKLFRLESAIDGWCDRSEKQAWPVAQSSTAGVADLADAHATLACVAQVRGVKYGALHGPIGA